MNRAALPALGALLLLAGCHSASVVATLHNGSPSEIRLIEVDYPSASFGTGSIAPGATYTYRFKILGSGSTKLTFLDAAGKEHTSTGPELQEGLEGQLQIEVAGADAGVQWTPKLTAKP